MVVSLERTAAKQFKKREAEDQGPVQARDTDDVTIKPSKLGLYIACTVFLAVTLVPYCFFV